MEQNTETKEEVSTESRNAVIKALAIIGFIAIVIIGIWTLVQAVRFAPSAFSTLASIAESIYVVDEDFVVTTQKNVANSGEAFVVSWTAMRADGDYSFTYECVDGVSGEVRNARNNIIEVACGSTALLGSDINDVEVILSSEKRRFTDVPYEITFTKPSGEALASADIVTIVNAAITQSTDIARENGEDEAEDEGETETEAPATPPATQTVPTTVTSIPVSDPSGTTDLKVTYLGIGTLDDDNEFAPAGTLDNDTRGAIRFEVRNIGTKTSDVWRFRADLPTSPAFTYTSEDQGELKPNERSVVTLGFNPGETGSATIKVRLIGEDQDSNSSNDSFDWIVTIMD